MPNKPVIMIVEDHKVLWPPVAGNLPEAIRSSLARPGIGKGEPFFAHYERAANEK